MRALNGWQRVWVVWSVVITALLIGMSAAKWPSFELNEFNYEQVKKFEAQRRLNYYQAADIERIKSDVNAGNYDFAMTPTKTLADFYPSDEEMQRHKQIHDDSQRYKTKRTAEERRYLAISMLLSWIAAVFGTYAAGLTFAWVWRGFARSS